MDRKRAFSSLGHSRAGEINHVVLVWLKDPGNESQRQQLIERSKQFTQIPGVLHVYMMRGAAKAFDQKSYDFTMQRTLAILEGLRGEQLRKAS